MSMIGNLVRVPEQVRTVLHQQPKSLIQLIYPDADPSDYVDESRPGFFARLFGAKDKTPEVTIEMNHVLSEGDALYIDKTWHVFHYLMTGSVWDGDFPKGFLLSCGESVADVDVGYGPVRSFSDKEVKVIDEMLQGLSGQTLKASFDVDEMNKADIYPGGWDESDEEWQYHVEFLEDMKTFVHQAAVDDLALLVYLN